MNVPLPQSTLFIRLRLLGDIVMTIPALLVFKRANPDIPVFYTLEEPFAELGRLLPGVDELFVIPKKMTFKEYRSWRKTIKNKGIDRVIDLHSGPKSALLTRLTGCPVRIGYKTKNRNWAYTHHCDNRNPGRPVLHSVINQLSLLEKIGVFTKDIPSYQLSSPIESLRLPANAERIVSSSKVQVVLHVGAGNRFRYWGDYQYTKLITSLVKDGIVCHLIGNSFEESRRAQEWIEISRHLVNDWVGKLSIVETLALISKCNCYFGPDSGPLHLASLTATPIVGLYGPTIPAISGPWRRQHVTILEGALPCRPCSQRKCRYDTIRCMEVINAEKALESILGYIVN